MSVRVEESFRSISGAMNHYWTVMAMKNLNLLFEISWLEMLHVRLIDVSGYYRVIDPYKKTLLPLPILFFGYAILDN